jgi:dienelactone hydrolase
LCLCLFLVFSGCNPAQFSGTVVPEVTPTAHTQGEAFTLTTADNVALAATIYRADGDLAVVYAHMGGNQAGATDQTTWSAFATETADQGMTALTFDFRCYGQSACAQGIATEMRLTDVLTAVRYLREQGYERIVCMGASMGGTACRNASMQEDLAGLVFIAGDSEILLNGKTYPDDIINPDMPKLFIVAEQDVSIIVSDTKKFYTISTEPRELLLYPETVHGTDIFLTPSGSQFHQALMDFLLAIK